MLRSEGERVQLIKEWRFRGIHILMSENSLFGIWCLVFWSTYPGSTGTANPVTPECSYRQARTICLPHLQQAAHNSCAGRSQTDFWRQHRPQCLHLA
ncbi:hypothetical protein Nit79A3_2351 [Nitrosomonas sp. Is79A3]